MTDEVDFWLDFFTQLRNLAKKNEKYKKAEEDIIKMILKGDDEDD